MKRFEEIPHTADWSFRAFGGNRSELFANAARAIFELEGAASIESAKTVVRNVSIKAIDSESLLVNWLNELLFLQEQHREVYGQFNFSRLTPTELDARVIGKPRRKMDKIVKAVTFHNLKIKQTQDGWQAVVVVDV